MPRVKPRPREDVPELKDMIDVMEKNMGFVANSLMTMAWWPELVHAFANLSRLVVFTESALPTEIKRLAAHVVSRSAGCQYCAAHSFNNAVANAGIAAEKVAAAFEYETSPLFSEAERAALRVAQAAGHAPSMADDADFAELRKFFDERQIVELIAVVSVYGFLNRWNDTMATALEGPPRDLATRHLTAKGWDVGVHGG